MYIDDLTIRCDGNTDGDFGDGDTIDKIEMVETFDISSDFAEEKFVHDARGNLTYDGRYAFTYDAWNNLVKVQRAWRDSANGDLHTGSTIAMMAFDGSGRRISKAVDNSGDWDCTYHYYLDGQRIVETRDGSDLVLTQQVWGLNYIDELVQTGVNQDVGCSVTYPNGPEDAPEVCERFFWILQDANYNVLGSAAATGLLLQRYEYDPYGRRTVFSHNWLLADMTDDGAVNVSEMSLLGTFGSTNDPADRRDLNGDGAINICDWSMMVGDYRNAGGIPNDALCSHPRGESGRGSHAGSWQYNLLPSGLCDFGHQGLLLDKEFDCYDNRAREYHAILMRMNQVDPRRYVNGMNYYQTSLGNPLGWRDPSGLTADSDVRVFNAQYVRARADEYWEKYLLLSARYKQYVDAGETDAKTAEDIVEVAADEARFWRELSKQSCYNKGDVGAFVGRMQPGSSDRVTPKMQDEYAVALKAYIKVATAASVADALASGNPMSPTELLAEVAPEALENLRNAVTEVNQFLWIEITCTRCECSPLNYTGFFKTPRNKVFVDSDRVLKWSGIGETKTVLLTYEGAGGLGRAGYGAAKLAEKDFAAAIIAKAKEACAVEEDRDVVQEKD